MKKLLLVSLSVFSLLGSAYAQSVPYGRCDTFSLHKTDLVMYYNFSGTASSGTISDLSGHGHTGVRAGLVTNTTDAGGNPDCALAFPGLPNNHVVISSSTDFDFAAHPATISLWYKAQETNASKYEQLAGRGLGRHYDMSGEYSAGLYDCRRPVAGINSNICWDSVVVTTPCDTSAGSYYLRTWNHLVVVFDNSGSGPTHPSAVYLNGIANTDWHGTGAVSDDTGNFYLGDNFKGIMDEVRVYNTAFSAADVSALYAYGIMGCCSPTGFEEIGNAPSTLSVYPNPATGAIRVDMPKQFTGGQLSILNALGQLVLHTAIKGEQENLDLQPLPAGIYILDCSTATGDTHIRQIITRQ